MFWLPFSLFCIIYWLDMIESGLAFSFCGKNSGSCGFVMRNKIDVGPETPQVENHWIRPGLSQIYDWWFVNYERNEPKWSSSKISAFETTHQQTKWMKSSPRSFPPPHLARTSCPPDHQRYWHFFFIPVRYCFLPQTRTSACMTPGGGASICSGRWRLVTWAGASWMSASPLTRSTCSTPAGLATVRQPEHQWSGRFASGSQ